MNGSQGKVSGAARAIRRIAQAWSIVSVGFLLLMFVCEVFYPSTTAMPTPAEWVGLFFFPFGV